MSVKPLERKTPGSLLQRLRGAHETELFGPRGRLPRRGEPDTSHNTALLILAGLIVAGLVLRLAVPRGIWLDEAISIHQARLSLHDLFQALYVGDRQPPLYHIVLWGTIRAFGHGEFAVRLPSLIAGTLVIPVLYELGRELYDRRTGLLAAGFAAISPMLIWYSQEVRMYEFAALFGLLALLMQLRAIRNPRSLGNWAGYIVASAALLWTHYFGLALVVVQLVVFVGVLGYRRRAGEDLRALAVGFGYSFVVLVMVAIPLLVFAHHQYQVTGSAAGSPSGTYDYLSFYSVLSNLAWSIWGYQPDAITVLLSALWPLFLLLSLVLLGRGGSRQTTSLGAAAIALVGLLIIASVFDHSLFEVRNFLILVPLVLLLIARLVTGWIRQPRVRAFVAAAVAATMLLGLADEQLNDSNPRLFDFKTAIQDIQADAGPNALVLYEPRDMRYVLEYYAPGLRRQGLLKPITAGTEASPVFVLASFQDNPVFFNQTNKVVGQLTFFRRLVARFKTPQTIVWEFQ
jgi:4-amino-4-deoxy-L-arabinose transferase-like glycosyltransferase